MTATPEESSEHRDELSKIRAERDVLRRELGDLRAHLCGALGLRDREPGPGGLEVLNVVNDREILAAVRRLVVDAAPTIASSEEAQWAHIDRLILAGSKIQAIQRIRELFGGGVHEALDMLVHRYDRLRHDRPDEFAKDADSYWDGFSS